MDNYVLSGYRFGKLAEKSISYVDKVQCAIESFLLLFKRDGSFPDPVPL